jgi:hypothetical protein
MDSHDEIQFQMGLSNQAIVDWKNYYRDVAAEWYASSDTKIGKQN